MQCLARATRDYTAQSDGEISLLENQQFVVVAQLDGDYWRGRVGELEGLFPRSACVLLESPPTSTATSTTFSSSPPPSSSSFAAAAMTAGSRSPSGTPPTSPKPAPASATGGFTTAILPPVTATRNPAARLSLRREGDDEPEQLRSGSRPLYSSYSESSSEVKNDILHGASDAADSERRRRKRRESAAAHKETTSSSSSSSSSSMGRRQKSEDLSRLTAISPRKDRDRDREPHSARSTDGSTQVSLTQQQSHSSSSSSSSSHSSRSESVSRHRKRTTDTSPRSEPGGTNTVARIVDLEADVRNLNRQLKKVRKQLKTEAALRESFEQRLAILETYLRQHGSDTAQSALAKAHASSSIALNAIDSDSDEGGTSNKADDDDDDDTCDEAELKAAAAAAVAATTIVPSPKLLAVTPSTIAPAPPSPGVRGTARFAPDIPTPPPPMRLSRENSPHLLVPTGAIIDNSQMVTSRIPSVGHTVTLDHSRKPIAQLQPPNSESHAASSSAVAVPAAVPITNGGGDTPSSSSDGDSSTPGSPAAQEQ